MSKAISNITTLCMVAILLVSMLSYTIARPIPTLNDAELHHTGEEELVNVKDCAGAGEEECLMRRTTVAHLDYIYTNKNNPGNL